MDALQSETFFSLSDLAAMNTDDVATLLTRTAQPGIYNVVGLEIKGVQSEGKEGKPPLTRFNIKVEVESAVLIDKNIDTSGYAGRKLTESYTLWPDQLQELLGLLKGRYQKVNLPNSGMPLGGVEGMEPGWLDTMVGHRFQIRVRTYISKGETQAAYEWIGPTPEDVPADEQGEVAADEALG